MALSKETKEELITKYNDKKGFLIPLLQDIQKIDNYISQESMKFIADSFQIKQAEIYGVVTFYSMFRLHPVGKHIIRICKGTACHVSGVDNIIFHLKTILQLEDGQETTADNEFTLMEVACLGCCSLAPAMMIDDKTYGNLTSDMLSSILQNDYSPPSWRG